MSKRMEFTRDLGISVDELVASFDQAMALYDDIGTVKYNNISNSDAKNNSITCTIEFSTAKDATFIRSIIDSKILIKYNHQFTCTTEQSDKELIVTIR